MPAPPPPDKLTQTPVCGYFNPEVKMLDDFTLVQRLTRRAIFFDGGDPVGSNHRKSADLYREAARRIGELEHKLEAIDAGRIPFFLLGIVLGGMMPVLFIIWS
jgi:hypothetical protein